MRKVTVCITLAVLVLGGLAACSGKDSSGTESKTKQSILSTAPVNSPADAGAIKARVDRAAVAADLRVAIQSAQTADLNDPGGGTQGGQGSGQEGYRQAVQQVATKYGIATSDVEAIADQYNISP